MGPQNKNHPPLAYMIGLVFLVISLAVGVGVIYHLTLSHHGPGLLRPFLKRHTPKEVPVLTGAQRQAKLDRHNHFHNIVRYPQLDEAHRPLCTICHTQMPHNNNKRVRALLNMHTPYLACESCHIKPDENRTIVFQWTSPVDPNPQGPFAGTRYDPKTGYLAEVDDKFSRITPFYKSGSDGFTSVAASDDRKSAVDYMSHRQGMSQAEREAATQKFHQNTAAKSPDCQACHSADGNLDFQSLGFSDKRVADLTHLNITGMLAKYESWYLPDLLSNPGVGSTPAQEGAPQQ